MLNVTYTYRLRLKPAQVKLYEEWLETSRKVWNFALAERKDWYQSRSCPINACSLRSEYIIPADAPRPSFASQCKALTQARKVYDDLAKANAQMLQQVLRRLDQSFVSMWKQGHGFPRFKKPGRIRSLLFPQLGENPIRGSHIKLPGVGFVKMRMSRPIPEGFEIKQARVVKRASGWYVMITLQCNVLVPEVMPNGQALEITGGLQHYLATSDGELIATPQFFVNLQRKLKLLQQRANHKMKGSNNWHKAHQKLAKLREHIHNCRQDFFYKLAHHLCDRAGVIRAEKLSFKTRIKKLLQKQSLDSAYGEFLRILKWVCWQRGVVYTEVDADKLELPGYLHHSLPSNSIANSQVELEYC
ncbi:MAG: transposase [Elainella sp. Prado103]|nr:transposase [Elainella sp. Prado103]